ncbi:endonuclease/exonuclease/phosphatase family protein [Thermomonospora catenispora]|uniref:endonuclease/exonuclease/phosphatase family protein n=1 Tax=Thermomonospora catenispora TaxID=2493090 RepID=UPI00111E8CD0|nr:endonuclease/exonuclease/phosphatase family protein [Thermomonospora catenispora]TNY36856.1 endonuclease/exonuclease/phosphatase family protein [Thermomonospora catenispora]
MDEEQPGVGGDRTGAAGRTDRWVSALAWAAVICWGLWALARLTGLDRAPGIDAAAVPLASFTPYIAASSVLPIAFAALLRRPRAVAGGAVVALTLACCVLPRALGGGQPDARGPALRVLTVNLLFGQADPRAVRDLVRRHDVDVLSLQELTPQAVARLREAGLERLLPHTVLSPRPGAGGTGLYARHPLRALPTVPDTVFAMPRAELTLPGGRTAEVTAVHPPPPVSRAAVPQWRHDIRALPSAGDDGVVRVLAGDFNATLDHAELRGLLDRGYADAADRTGKGLIHTWRDARLPAYLTIDHVLVDRRCAVRATAVHDVPGSDHRAVFADIRLP